jgi:hypothetical protein
VCLGHEALSASRGAAVASLSGACGGRTSVLVDSPLSRDASPPERDAGEDSFVPADSSAPAGLITGLTTASPALCRVDYLNANSGTPSLSDLMPYGAVLAANENGSAYDDPTGLGGAIVAAWASGTRSPLRGSSRMRPARSVTASTRTFSRVT